MDDLKERIIVKAKDFRLDSFATQKNNPKLKELFAMSESEIRKIDMSEYLNLSSDNLGTSQVIVQDLFELIDELIVRDGGSLPE